MKTLICTKPGNLEYHNADEPALLKDHAIIKIKRIGICGTDLHAYEGTQPYFSYPRILGHELSGELIVADNAPGFETGERVTFLPYFNCGHCIACRQGRSNCCADLKVFGVHIDGGMSEFIQVPSRYLVHGRQLGYDELALVEPLAIGAHGIRRAGVVPGEFVLVIGAGPIGIGTMEFARIAGARVIAMEVNATRLEYCRNYVGAHYVIDGRSENVRDQLLAITGGDMPSVVIDATGSVRAIDQTLQYLSHGGRIVLIGLQKEAFTFSHPEFHKREATLMSSRNATREDFEYVLDCLAAKQVQSELFISRHVDFDEAATQFESWMSPDAGIVKVLLDLP